MNYLRNKTILITGGTGSFGSSFVKEIIKKKYGIKKIIIFSRDELKQFEVQKKLNIKSNILRFFLGDIRDKSRLIYAFKGVDVVVHAAALKQVPAAEYNPLEFVKTNVLGSQNVIEACIDSKVKKVIALSTDKAVSPLNLYGATKLCADKLFVSANNITGNQNISFAVVRYGNILMDEAIKLVLWSIQSLKGGEIVIPKLKSFWIKDLALALNHKAKFTVIGTRPGEKIHEELMSIADSQNVYQLKDKYLLISNQLIKNNYKNTALKKLTKNFSYNSLENNFLTVNELRKIIKKNFNYLID